MDAGSRHVALRQCHAPAPSPPHRGGPPPHPVCRELVKHQAKPHIVLKLLGLSDVADTVVRLTSLHRPSTPC